MVVHMLMNYHQFHKTQLLQRQQVIWHFSPYTNNKAGLMVKKNIVS